MYPREILLLRLYRASTAAADPRFRSLCSLFSHRERSGSVRFLPEKRYKKTNAKRRLFCYVPPGNPAPPALSSLHRSRRPSLPFALLTLLPQGALGFCSIPTGEKI